MEEEHKPEDALHGVFAQLPSQQPKPRRWMLPALVGVYGLSVLAAFAILLRGAPPTDAPAGSKSSLLKHGRFLAAAKEPGIGWIPIHGAIYGSASGRPWERGMEQWNKRLQTLADKPEIKAIVLDINSPGGSVGAVQELYSTINRIREEKKKPVVTLVGDLAAGL